MILTSGHTWDWWRNKHYRNMNMHLIWSPDNTWWCACMLSASEWAHMHAGKNAGLLFWGVWIPSGSTRTHFQLIFFTLFIMLSDRFHEKFLSLICSAHGWRVLAVYISQCWNTISWTQNTFIKTAPAEAFLFQACRSQYRISRGVPSTTLS